jgi:tRNA pseudouridine38-40 synthase
MRLKAVIAYDGTDYHGWQIQKKHPTIQSILQDCLQHICGQAVDVTGAGRTDSGVHAYGQVAHFDWNHELPVQKMILGMNALLPSDIRVLALEETTPQFHARFDTKSKIYLYRINRSRFHSPFHARYSLHYRHPLDTTLLSAAAEQLKGKHDFLAFQATGTDVVSTIRVIHDVEILTVNQDQTDFLYVRIHSNGFLRKMARMMIGTMIEIASGKRPAKDLTRALETGDRKYVGVPAPARGLFLEKVIY